MNRSQSFAFLSCLLCFGAIEAKAAPQPCNADASVASFQKSAKAVLSQLPALDGDVDKCFNTSWPGSSYISKTHKTFKNMMAQYTSSVSAINDAYDDLQRGKDADFIDSVTKLTAGIDAVNKPLIDYSGNLKKDGFVTSDKMENGQYKYPLCNSKTNDGPAERWDSVYGNVMAIQKANAALRATAACLKK